MSRSHLLKKPLTVEDLRRVNNVGWILSEIVTELRELRAAVSLCRSHCQHHDNVTILDSGDWEALCRWVPLPNEKEWDEAIQVLEAGAVE